MENLKNVKTKGNMFSSMVTNMIIFRGNAKINYRKLRITKKYNERKCALIPSKIERKLNFKGGLNHMVPKNSTNMNNEMFHFCQGFSNGREGKETSITHARTDLLVSFHPNLFIIIFNDRGKFRIHTGQ